MTAGEKEGRCVLCGRETYRHRMTHGPRLSGQENAAELFCLHQVHLHGDELPPCESGTLRRIEVMKRALERIASGATDSLAGDPAQWPSTIAAMALGWVNDEPGGPLHPPRDV